MGFIQLQLLYALLIVMLNQVMIFSFGAKHGRILQAFYDGKNLVIRKSKLIDLTDLSSRPFDVFVRFAASKPVGNTRTSLYVQKTVSGERRGGRT